MTDDIKYKLIKSCARMHDVQRVRGCNKIKHTHKHIHGESEEDGVSKNHPPILETPPTPPPRGCLAELKSRPGRVSCEGQCVLH